MFPMLILVEADLAEHGTEIARLSPLPPFFISGLLPHFLCEVVPIISYSAWRVSSILCVCVCRRVCVG